jgi:hypothetical protein
VSDHPLNAMWKARYEAEHAAAQERAARRALRETQQVHWKEAWEDYKARRLEGMGVASLPPWWHLRDWLRVLFGKPRPHR